ncbi:MAG: nucleotidyl transferase AbiEii/AbiGii toxin family protein [Deltaproteobacteria bacterium]|nr:nucleotidyl transferase AbiEii/AbiGii toxin family protein [Deltaproteobacteria bacterium]
MHQLEQHEIFEIETLQFMKSKRLLDSLVFGGGTMLRLCHDLKRYSVYMDFYFKKKEDYDLYFSKIQNEFSNNYTVIDAYNKFNTILLEIRHDRFQRKLKIEINKKKRFASHKTAIAYSSYSTLQVHVDTVSLENMMMNKIEALLDRKEIRDAFDIEFLIRRNIKFPDDADKAAGVLKTIKQFKKNNFAVKLGSLLQVEEREYYRQNHFKYLEHYLATI